MQNKINILIICETFYSIQGEGKNIGKPAIFLRLTNCNLNCYGNISNQGLTCDSKKLWLKGEEKKFAQIIAVWQKNGWLEKLKNGAHLVITGGEPLLQQNALKNFIEYFLKSYKFKPFIEIETNGTILPNKNLYVCVSQFNVSPKLTNSGNELSLRYKTNIIKFFATNQKCFFKFVIATKNDTEEVFLNYINPFKINKKKVYLMPAGQTQKELITINDMVIELCKEHGLNFSPRLHIMLWGNKAGM